MGANYRLDIDGLRAVAVTPVVFYHAGAPAFPGGYVGVDVFFVISGFLIAGIISREIAEKRFSIVNFYERRARRILPALFLVVAATLSAGWLTSWPGNFEEIAESALATIFFSSNFYFWETTDYFATASEYRPLLHTWSLAVEEQFYIFFPLFLVLMARMPRSALVICSSVIFAASLVASVVSTQSMPVAAFYLAPARTWELFLGVFLALNMIPSWSNQLLRELAACIGIFLILISVVSYDSTTSFPGLAAVVPCLGTALVVQAGRGDGPETMVSRLLSLRVLVFIGLISYSLYLWHWVVLALARSFLETPDLPPDWSFFCVAISVVLAAISWRFVERPFRVKATVSRAGVFRFSGGVAALLVCLAVSILAADGYPGRISSKALAALAGEQDVEPGRKKCMGLKADARHCVIGSDHTKPSGMLLGDSHAVAIMSAVDLALEQENLSAFVASYRACPPLLGVTRVGNDTSAECSRFIAYTLAFIDANRDSLDYVILSARWPLNATGERAPDEPGDPVRLASISDDYQLSNSRAFEIGLGAFVERVTATGVDVIILGGVPEIGWNVPRSLALAEFRDVELPDAPTLEDLGSRHFEAEQILTKVAEKENVSFIPIAPLLCDPDCQVFDGPKPLYVDDDHLSRHGARNVLGPKLAPELAGLLGAAEAAGLTVAR